MEFSINLKPSQDLRVTFLQTIASVYQTCNDELVFQLWAVFLLLKISETGIYSKTAVTRNDRPWGWERRESKTAIGEETELEETEREQRERRKEAGLRKEIVADQKRRGVEEMKEEGRKGGQIAGRGGIWRGRDGGRGRGWEEQKTKKEREEKKMEQKEEEKNWIARIPWSSADKCRKLSLKSSFRPNRSATEMQKVGTRQIKFRNNRGEKRSWIAVALKFPHSLLWVCSEFASSLLRVC